MLLAMTYMANQSWLRKTKGALSALLCFQLSLRKLKTSKRHSKLQCDLPKSCFRPAAKSAASASSFNFQALSSQSAFPVRTPIPNVAMPRGIEVLLTTTFTLTRIGGSLCAENPFLAFYICPGLSAGAWC